MILNSVAKSEINFLKYEIPELGIMKRLSDVKKPEINFVEVSGHNLEIYQTLGLNLCFRISTKCYS
jgi:hypothetical protein